MVPGSSLAAFCWSKNGHSELSSSLLTNQNSVGQILTSGRKTFTAKISNLMHQGLSTHGHEYEVESEWNNYLDRTLEAFGFFGHQK